MADRSFGRAVRVRSGADFGRAYAKRVVVSDGHLVVFVHANTTDRPRLGVVVSKKVGGAVVRNRWKRLLRESFRLQKSRLDPGFDYIVMPRKGAKPDFQPLRASLKRLARRGVGRWKRHSGEPREER